MASLHVCGAIHSQRLLVIFAWKGFAGNCEFKAIIGQAASHPWVTYKLGSV